MSIPSVSNAKLILYQILLSFIISVILVVYLGLASSNNSKILSMGRTNRLINSLQKMRVLVSIRGRFLVRELCQNPAALPIPHFRLDLFLSLESSSRSSLLSPKYLSDVNRKIEVSFSINFLPLHAYLRHSAHSGKQHRNTLHNQITEKYNTYLKNVQDSSLWLLDPFKENQHGQQK